jgi:acetyl esterase/lipase
MRITTAIIAFVICISCADAQAGPIRDMLKKRAEKASVSDAKQLSNVAYGDNKKQTLDVYLPNTPKNAPIIIMVHGGAWKIGDKDSSKVVTNKVNRWVSKGAIFVSVNYRLLPEADPLKQAEDVALAIAYVQSHASEWGGDTNKIVLMGHSAGAHLVSLVSADYTKYRGLKPWLGTISLDSAAMDVVSIMSAKHYGFYDEAFGGDKAYWESVSPYYRLGSSSLPLLMVCSTVRPDKPCKDAERLEQKAKGMSIKTQILPEPLKHGEINEQLGLDNDYTRKVDEFLKSIGF